MSNQSSLFGSDEGAPATKKAQAARESVKPEEPLAAHMRPRTLDEVVGQEYLVEPGRLLRRSIEGDRVPSMILWGPPGSGKTTLAEIIARQTHAHFVSLSAVSAGVADLRKVVEDARKLRQFSKQRTILFIDEIHRFNKAQQDAVLPHVERGTVTLIGATTENPSFEVISALLSRCRVFTLRGLSEEHILTILHRALADRERGLGQLGITIDEDALQQTAIFANGDARTALNVLELAASAAITPAGNQDLEARSVAAATHITLPLVEEIMQHRALL